MKPAQRSRVEKGAMALIAEEMTLKQFRRARKAWWVMEIGIGYAIFISWLS
jgi:hypothetical protein